MISDLYTEVTSLPLGDDHSLVWSTDLVLPNGATHRDNLSVKSGKETGAADVLVQLMSPMCPADVHQNVF